jgi:hypothetical protein
MILIALLSVWWLFLQRDARVVNLVDSLSFVTAVYSSWQVVRTALRWSRSVRVRHRGEVGESREECGTARELGIDAAKCSAEGGVAGRQDDRCRQGADVREHVPGGVAVGGRGFRFTGHRAQHYRQRR